MNQMLGSLWTKIVDNKHAIIRITGAVAGALIGTGIANVIVNAQEPVFYEEMTDQIDVIVE